MTSDAALSSSLSALSPDDASHPLRLHSPGGPSVTAQDRIDEQRRVQQETMGSAASLPAALDLNDEPPYSSAASALAGGRIGREPVPEIDYAAKGEQVTEIISHHHDICGALHQEVTTQTESGHSEQHLLASHMAGYWYRSEDRHIDDQNIRVSVAAGNFREVRASRSDSLGDEVNELWQRIVHTRSLLAFPA